MSRFFSHRVLFIFVIAMLFGLQVAPAFAQTGVDGLGDIATLVGVYFAPFGGSHSK
jgi:hypothetical protein